MKKRDMQIILLVVCFAIVGLIISRAIHQKSDSNYAIIYVDSQEYKRVSLNNPQIVVIDQNGKHNVIKITTKGVLMQDANCKNHDCINEGEATLDNMDTRALGGWIICLPNKVAIKLVKGENK